MVTWIFGVNEFPIAEQTSKLPSPSSWELRARVTYSEEEENHIVSHAMASKSQDATSSITNSGIVTDEETGQRHIPSSVRADGSKRKEIKIRPGYRPAEDVAVYKNRAAHAYQTRGTGGIPGAESLKEDDGSKADDGKLNKNAKRREARRKAKVENTTADVNGEGEENASTNTASVEVKDSAVSQPPSSLTKEEEEQIERDKKARKLKKKLREAKELQEKKAKGEKLLQEQFEKVIKINELIRDLAKLGFDSNGEPKEKDED